MISLRSHANRMSFLLQLQAGTLSKSDIESIAVMEATTGCVSGPRAVRINGVRYDSITEAAAVEVIYRRSQGTMKYRPTALEHHRAVNRVAKQYSRALQAGVAGYQYA